jgi:dTDP-4-dehydrorhamnose 3,5-epimerase
MTFDGNDLNECMGMIFTETLIKGAYILEIRKLEDERGFFGRSWCKNELEACGLNANVVQADTSFSKYRGTFRGMHYQVHPFEEAKLIRCTKGAIFDLIIDLRKNSPTFLKWFGTELSESNYRMLYVPEKFAHGFVTLTNNCEVSYMVTQFYNPQAERGLRWNDPVFDILLPVEVKIISDKDRTFPDFDEAVLP